MGVEIDAWTNRVTPRQRRRPLRRHHVADRRRPLAHVGAWPAYLGQRNYNIARRCGQIWLAAWANQRGKVVTSVRKAVLTALTKAVMREFQARVFSCSCTWYGAEKSPYYPRNSPKKRRCHIMQKGNIVM